MRYLILLLSFSLFANAIITTKVARTTQFANLNDGQCYYRTDCSETIENLIASDIQQFKCATYTEPAKTSGIFKFQVCEGSTTEAGSVTFIDKYYTMSIENCSDISQTIDGCENEIVYVDGFPMTKNTNIDNASYFNDYTNELICNNGYLQINNSICLMPSYTSRNLADAILKRDKIARENNLTNVSSISENNITYTDTGAIESFSFTAINTDGAIELIATSFVEDETIYKIEEDGSITESIYDPTTDTNTDTTTNTDGTSTNTDDTTTDNTTNIDDSSSSTTTTDNTQIEQNTTAIKNSINDIKEYLSTDNIPVLNNTMEDSVDWYDNYVIDEITTFVTNLTADFTSIKNQFADKFDYIENNAFEFDYQTTLYETCEYKKELDLINDNTIEINIDVCKMLSDANMLHYFYILFYSFFYAVFLIFTFSLSFKVFRSL